jgi:hypothetical protein
MADRKVRLVERTVLALLKLGLELARIHAVDQIERSRAKLHSGTEEFVGIVSATFIVVRIRGRDKRERADKRPA